MIYNQNFIVLGIVTLTFVAIKVSEGKTCLDGSGDRKKKSCSTRGCDAGWQQIHEDTPHASPQCYCVRPFNAAEQKENTDCKCDNFLDQCLNQIGMKYSCGRAKEVCKEERRKQECAHKKPNNDKEYEILCTFGGGKQSPKQKH